MNCGLAPFIFASFILFLSCIKTRLNAEGARTSTHLLPSVSDVGVPQAVRKLQVGFHPTGEPPPGADRWWRGCSLWGLPDHPRSSTPSSRSLLLGRDRDERPASYSYTHTYTLTDRNVRSRPPSSLQLHHPLLLL